MIGPGVEVVQLLQQAGLTQYEAEAYYTLLREGPLTGYALGSRSSIPLPRSYDVLKRLTQRGLALVQPGDPPRYRAVDPALFVDQLRSTMTTTLDELARQLSTLPEEETGDDFWVARTRPNILAQLASMVNAAERSIHIFTPAARSPEVDEVIALARGRHQCELSLSSHPLAAQDQVAVLVDDRAALLGTISPPDRCQAVVSTNPALVGAVRSYVREERDIHAISQISSPGGKPDVQRRDWLRWEEEKQRRLLGQGRSVA